jgi:hypothetical protein
LHLAAIGRFLIEQETGICNRLGLSLTAGANQIQQTFDFGVIVNDFPLAINVDEVIRVQAVVLTDVDAWIPVA